MDADLADLIADDPAAALYALDCADARDSFHTFCGMVELPGVALTAEPATRDRIWHDDGTWEEDDDDTGELSDIAFLPVETPQAAHHKLLISTLERVERGELRRVMVFMPPGSAKSTYASVAFPAWYMGRKRGRNVGVATYATGLARKVGRRIRAIARQRAYEDIFGTTLTPGNGAVNEWSLTNGNEFMGEGILAGWTGNRLDGLVIDDPVKNREEASSPVIQAKTKDEYDSSLKSRLKPGGFVVLILTRWDENDLAGQILPENWDGESGDILCRDGLVWHVLCLPAEALENDPLGRKPGEMLWPEWFGKDPDFWTSARRNTRLWSALYQQNPTPGLGTYFRKEWFRRYRLADIAGLSFRKYLSSDHAPTDHEESDPSTCRVWGVPAVAAAELADLYLLDGFSHRETMNVTADKIVGNLRDRLRDPSQPAMDGLIRKHKPFAWFPEDDNNWKSAAPFIKRRIREEGLHIRIEPLSPHGGDKAVKAQSFQGMAASGRVWIPEGPEGDAIIDQFVKFPAGKHDEEVDCAAIIGRAIDMAHPAIVPPEKPPPGEMKGPASLTLDQLLARQDQERDDRVR